jgi:dienelactone hydrolase
MNKLIFGLLLLGQIAFAQLPGQPKDTSHPGSGNYDFTLKQESFQANGRKVDVYLPLERKGMAEKAPGIVFGHGQAIGVEGYQLTFEHLAKKGFVVIHPMYDKGFFDQDWRRMSRDFNSLTSIAIKKYAEYADPNMLLYSGHSKGAYIALMAAGDPSRAQMGLKVGSVVLFAPAGYDAAYLRNIDPSIPVTLAWSDGDTVIKQSLVTEIYRNLPSKFKQWILVKSYSSARADHFFPLSKSYIFGGQNGVSPYHYFSVWKWLGGAALDLELGSPVDNPFIYGSDTSTTGVNSLQHSVSRSW